MILEWIWGTLLQPTEFLITSHSHFLQFSSTRINLKHRWDVEKCHNSMRTESFDTFPVIYVCFWLHKYCDLIHNVNYREYLSKKTGTFLYVWLRLLTCLNNHHEKFVELFSCFSILILSRSSSQSRNHNFSRIKKHFYYSHDFCFPKSSNKKNSHFFSFNVTRMKNEISTPQKKLEGKENSN